MKKLQKGFTLIELMIVVAIIAILAAVAAPKFGVQIKKAKDAKGLAVIGVLRSASTVEYADNDGVAETDYNELVKLIDDKSAGLVNIGTDTTVDVGLNLVGTDVTEVVQLDAPSTTDGTIAITSDAAVNGTDAKKEPWSKY